MSAFIQRLNRKLPVRVLALALAVACSDASTAPPTSSGPDPIPPPVDLSGAWSQSSAANEGFDAVALDRAFDDAANVQNIRALVVVRNGRLVREAYFGDARPDTALDLRSVTKTVTALLVGIAADQGLLDIDDPIVSWLQDDAMRTEHEPIRIRHLLTMTSGMRWSDAADFNPWVLSGRPVGYVLDQEVLASPGEMFMYNTGGSHLLAVIVGSATGINTLDFARQRLFEPLGITNFRWPLMQDGVPAGGAALALLPTDAAKIGQLLLQGGRSGSDQIVSAGWVDAQTLTQVPLGGIAGVLTDGGYGYQTWTDGSGGGAGVRAFVMWGFGGQFVWVVPDRQLVVVAAAHWRGSNDFDGRQARRVATDAVRRVVAAATPQ
jgi:CubicO group peptidase (beta-lactamase class C family)